VYIKREESIDKVEIERRGSGERAKIEQGEGVGKKR
jgi:hypothetical protein